MAAKKRSPFYAGTYGGHECEVIDVQSRLEHVARFNAATCRHALKTVKHLQKSVRTAIERRLRKLAKGRQS